MKNKRNIFILLIFLVCILAISSASAAEDNANDIISIDDGEALTIEESSNDAISFNDNEEIIKEESSNDEWNIEDNENTLSAAEDDRLGETLSYTQLNELINGNNNSEIYLENDYLYSDADSQFKDGILINRSVTIYGNGHTINGNGVHNARIFQVTNSSAIFKDIVFYNGYSTSYGGAINGKSTAINCTFDNNRANNGGAMYDGTAINCTFKYCYAYENAAAMYHGRAYNCTFLSNRSPGYGGATNEIFARNCTFTNNSGGYGGAMYKGTAINCSFENNRCNQAYSDAIHRGVALNCIFINNENDVYTTVCTEMKFEFGDFTTRYDSGVKLNVGLYANNRYHDAMYYTTKISIYNDDELIKTQQVTSSNDWAVILEPGTYTATFTVPDIPEVQTHTITINILKRNVTIEAVNSSIKYNSGEPFVIFLRDERKDIGIANLTIAVDIDGIQGNYTSNETGYVSVPIDDSKLGTYEVVMTLNDHPHYNDASANASITIIKRQAIIECEDSFSSEYNSSDLFTITLHNDLGQALAGAELVIDLIGETYITDENGQIPLPANKFAGGEHTVTISYSEGEYCFGTNKTIIILIAKQNTKITATNLTTIHFSDDKFNATLVNDQGNPIAGALLTFDWTGETFITDERGQIKVPIKSLTAGNYTGTIIFDGNENYTGSMGMTKLIIKKEEPYLSTYTTIVVYGRDDYFGVTLYDYWGKEIVGAELSNNVSDEISITNENGLTRIHTKDWAAGNYSVMVMYAGNSNYTKVNTTVRIVVMKSKTSFYAPNVTAIYNEDKNLTITLLDIDNHPMPTMPIRLYSEDIKEISTDENGQIIIPLKGMDMGKHKLSLFYDGNENYSASSANASITITPRKVDFDVAINGDNTEVSIINASTDDGTLVNGTLYGELIRNGVKFKDLGNTRIIDGEGNISIPADLGPGIYYVALFLETDTGDLSHNQLMFIIKSKEVIIKVNADDISYGQEAVIGFTVTDIDDNKFSGNLDVSLGDINTTVPVTDGVGELKINLSAGNYLVVATYTVDDNSFIGTDTFKVERLGTQIIFKDMTTKAVSPVDGRIGEYFTWTLLDSNGKPLANVPMEIGFNGVVYTEKDGIRTDENGNAKLQINLGYKGVYTFAICYLGDENHNASFVVAKITVDCQTPILTVPNKSYKATAKTKTLTATFKSTKGTPISDKRVSFTVNGKTYKAKTNANGLATVNISISQKGTYSVVAKYAGDSTYAAISKKATLKIS